MEKNLRIKTISDKSDHSIFQIIDGVVYIHMAPCFHVEHFNPNLQTNISRALLGENTCTFTLNILQVL